MQHRKPADSFWHRRHWGWDPSLALESLKLSMNDLLYNLFAKGTELQAPLPWNPNADLSRRGDALFLELALPGVEKRKLEIHATSELVIIKGTTLPCPDSSQVFFQEIQRGEFFRVIPLPFPIDPEAISAELKKGILTLSLPINVQNQSPEREVDIQ